MKKSNRDPATNELCMIKNRQETECCPTRACCVGLWGGEDIFSSIRDLTKFELIYKQDDLIYKMGGPVTSVYVIQSGAIKLEKEVEGGNHVSGFYFTGDLIGLESVDLEQHQYNAIALKETWVCEIRLNKLDALGKSALSIRQTISTLLNRKLREIDEHLYNTRHLRIEQRLLIFLNQLCNKNLDYIDDSLNQIALPISKVDIANYLGMRPESLSRALREFKSQGIVKNNEAGNLTIINKQKLLSKVTKNSVS